VKFPKKAWEILRGYLENTMGELHSLVQGHRTEKLSTLIMLSVADHRGKWPAKNWLSESLVPQEEKDKCLAFWKTLLSPGDYQWFEERGLA
jgi:hypothetical protein